MNLFGDSFGEVVSNLGEFSTKADFDSSLFLGHPNRCNRESLSWILFALGPAPVVVLASVNYQDLELSFFDSPANNASCINLHQRSFFFSSVLCINIS